MTLNVTRYLNKTVFVSIPAIFEDVACRAYKLLGVELNGLWLQSDELTRRLLLEDHRDLASGGPAVFVPFAQIAGVLVATSATPPASEAVEASASTSSATAQPQPAPQGAGSSPRRPRPKKSSTGIRTERTQA